MSNRYDLVTFDLDGTLLNSIEGIARSYRQACQDFGFPLPPTKEVTYWVGQGHDVAVSCCFLWLEKQLQADRANFPCFTDKADLLALDHTSLYQEHVLAKRAEFKEIHTRYYQAIDPSDATPYPGVLRTLEELRNAGVHLAVLTNKPNFLVKKVLDCHHLTSFFDVVYADGDLPHNKPHPEGLLRLLAKYEISDPKKLLMVGDSENDVKAGLAANAEVLGLTYGYNYGKDIALANPTYTSGNFCACLALTKGIALDSPEFAQLVADIEQ